MGESSETEPRRPRNRPSPFCSACIIGLRIYATVPMLVVDAAVNIFLTTAFVIPIARSSFVKARRLARNSCIAAVAALITSFANIVVLSVQHGQ